MTVSCLVSWSSRRKLTFYSPVGRLKTQLHYRSLTRYVLHVLWYAIGQQFVPQYLIGQTCYVVMAAARMYKCLSCQWFTSLKSVSLVSALEYHHTNTRTILSYTLSLSPYPLSLQGMLDLNGRHVLHGLNVIIKIVSYLLYL